MIKTLNNFILTITAIFLINGCSGKKTFLRDSGKREPIFDDYNMNPESNLSSLKVVFEKKNLISTWNNRIPLHTNKMPNFQLNDFVHDDDIKLSLSAAIFESSLLSFSEYFLYEKGNFYFSHDGQIIRAELDGTMNNITDIETSKNEKTNITIDSGIIFCAKESGKISAIDIATSKVIWSKMIQNRIDIAPKVYKNLLLVVDHKDTLHCYNKNTGSFVFLNYGVKTNMKSQTKPCLACDDDVIISMNLSGEAYGISTNDGEELWKRTVTKQDSILYSSSSSSPIIDGKNALLCGVDLSSYLDKKTGQLIWKKNIGTFIEPIIQNNFVFVMGTDQKLYCIEKTSGKIKWIRKTNVNPKKYVNVISIMAIENDIWLITDSGQLQIINPFNGIVRSQVSLGFILNNPPQIINGNMYVIKNKKVHKILFN